MIEPIQNPETVKIALRLIDAIKIVNECWEWQLFRDKGGYGQSFVWDGHKSKTARAHRLSYEIFRGNIAEGLVIDHICRNRACINPRHLETVTTLENTMRGYGAAALNSKKTECFKGHPFSEENTIIGYKKGKKYRACRTCKNILNRSYKLKRRVNK